jgi:geranylgeranyl diphosphate synthase type II
MRYPVFAGGKRLRPALLLATVRCLGGDEGAALPIAAALELIHTYSLVHDDLPAMDDDALRRGLPTCHVAYDEATAILVGDALLTLAFEILTAEPVVCAEVARAVGSKGMIAGQALDLEAAGTKLDGSSLERIHRLKTGTLISASVVCGALLAGAPQPVQEALRSYGQGLGLAFQIVDDLLDVEGDTVSLGKTAGKDARDSKATFPAVWGLEESRRRALAAAQHATAALEALDGNGDLLARIADFVLQRDR